MEGMGNGREMRTHEGTSKAPEMHGKNRQKGNMKRGGKNRSEPKHPKQIENSKQQQTDKFKHPPVVGDLVALLNYWVPIHIGMNRRWRAMAGRLTTTITKILEISMEASFLKNKLQQKRKLLHARAKIDVAKALAHCLWTHKALSDNHYSEITKKLLWISVQLTKWQHWTEVRNTN